MVPVPDPDPSPRRGPRSLAEDLRSRTDDGLAALLLARPELASPVPADTTALAARASTRAATARAMDALDVPALQVLEVLAALTVPGRPPPAPGDVAGACGADLADVAPVLERLRTAALVWGAPDARAPLRAAVDLLGPTPAGLGPWLVDAMPRSPSRVAAVAADLGLPPTGDPEAALRAVAALVGDPERLEVLLADAPAGARELLARLAPGPPVGAVEDADRPVRAADARTPVEWLLARALLAPVARSAVVLPREVAVALRGGRVRDGLDPLPVAATTDRSAQRVDAQGGGAAAEVVRLVHELLDGLGQAPSPVLRAGGMGVRELRRTAARLDVAEADAAFVVELARLSGLLGDDGEADPAWAPTPAHDRWLAGDAATRWTTLATAWLATSRVPALVGTRDERGAVRAALAPDLDRTAAPVVRAAVLADLAAQPPGTAVDARSLAERVRWHLPRRAGAVGGRLADFSLREAERLGVVALGALTTAGRALLAVAGGGGSEQDGSEQDGGDVDGPGGDAAAALRRVLPAPVDQVVLQADLTAVAPGPLVADLAARMALVADVESRGGATVYRFSPASVRRAMDAGQERDQIVTLLRERSSTPVPQALERLVDDVARRHGSLRVGAASSYVRGVDAAALAEVLTDPRAAPLRLVALAPTVAASPAEPGAVLAVLRSMGLAPAAEGDGAAVVLAAPQRRRCRETDPPRPVTGRPPPLTPARAGALVAALRAADRAASASGGRAGRPDGDGPDGAPGAPSPEVVTSTTQALGVLRAAVDGQRRAWLVVADAGGRRQTSQVWPLAVEAGAVVVADAATGAVSRVPAHRVAGAALS